VTMDLTIDKLKNRIFRIYSALVLDEIRIKHLKWNHVILEDSKTLDKCNLKDGAVIDLILFSEIQVTAEKLKDELGTAVGGKKIQTFEKDKYGPRAWDLKRARRIVLHIINGEMFEHITENSLETIRAPILKVRYEFSKIPWSVLYAEDPKDPNANQTESNWGETHNQEQYGFKSFVF